MKELTTEQKEIQELLDKGVSIREASRIVFERDSKESTIRGWINQGILQRGDGTYNIPPIGTKRQTGQEDTEDVVDKEVEYLCESTDITVARLAKRLRSLQKANNELRKVNRVSLDVTDHFSEMIDSVNIAASKLNAANVNAFNYQPKASTPATLEILFSDFQIGKVGQYYNSNLAKRSIETYGREILNKIKERGNTYKVEKIVFASLGDTVEDHLKHGVQSATSTDCGLSQQMAMAIEYMWAYLVQPLASLGIPMEFIGIAGNHGSSQHKGMDMYKAGLYSYDYTIYKALEGFTKAAGYTNVKFYIPEGVFAYTQIYGRYVVYEHGYFNNATEKSMEDQMKKRGQQIKKHVEYFRCGDMHHLCSYDSHKMVLNGAFFGTDSDGVEYSGILGFNSIPAQAIMFHTDERSIGKNTVKEFIGIQVAEGY